METKEITISWIKGLIRNRDKFAIEFDKYSHDYKLYLAYCRLSGYIDSITSLYPDLCGQENTQNVSVAERQKSDTNDDDSVPDVMTSKEQKSQKDVLP